MVFYFGQSRSQIIGRKYEAQATANFEIQSRRETVRVQRPKALPSVPSACLLDEVDILD